MDCRPAFFDGSISSPLQSNDFRTETAVAEKWLYRTANFTVEFAEQEVGFVDPLVHDSVVVDAIVNDKAIVTRVTARVLWRDVEIGSASLADCIYPFFETRIDPSTGLTHDEEPNDHGCNIQIDHSYRRKVTRWAIADARTSLAELRR